MSPHPAARLAGRSALLATTLFGAIACQELPTPPSDARPGVPARRLGDAPVDSIPGPLDVTPQPPPPSFR